MVSKVLHHQLWIFWGFVWVFGNLGGILGCFGAESAMWRTSGGGIVPVGYLHFLVGKPQSATFWGQSAKTGGAKSGALAL